MWYKFFFQSSFASPPNVRFRPVPFFQITKEMNIHHKEMSGDSINVVKKGLKLFLKIIIV